MTDVLRSRLPFVLGLALVGVLGWRAMERFAASQADAAAERAQIAAEIEAERAAQAAAAKEARAAREAEAAAERNAATDSDRDDRAASLAGLREVDRLLLLDYRGVDLGARKRLDITGDQPFRIAVYQEEGRRSVTSARVDLDRDDRWDERWVFEEDGRVRREVSPADDEDYTVFEVLAGDAFVPEGSQ